MIPRGCTPTEPCGMCGRCVWREAYSAYYNDTGHVPEEAAAVMIDRALAARAEWMREQAFELVCRRLLRSTGYHEGTEIDSPMSQAIRALPLAPGGDDEG